MKYSFLILAIFATSLAHAQNTPAPTSTPTVTRTPAAPQQTATIRAKTTREMIQEKNEEIETMRTQLTQLQGKVRESDAKLEQWNKYKAEQEAYVVRTQAFQKKLATENNQLKADIEIERTRANAAVLRSQDLESALARANQPPATPGVGSPTSTIPPAIRTPAR